MPTATPYDNAINIFRERLNKSNFPLKDYGPLKVMVDGSIVSLAVCVSSSQGKQIRRISVCGIPDINPSDGYNVKEIQRVESECEQIAAENGLLVISKAKL
jgi:hypothetical protein